MSQINIRFQSIRNSLMMREFAPVVIRHRLANKNTSVAAATIIRGKHGLMSARINGHRIDRHFAGFCRTNRVI